MLGERVQLARHAVIEPHADGQQQVAVADGTIAVHAAVHAEHIQ